MARASVGNQPFGAHPVELPALGGQVLLCLAHEFLESRILAHGCDVGPSSKYNCRSVNG